MLKVMSRLLRKQQTSYARKVASALFREGFDPKLLDEMQSIGAFSQDSIIFRVLRDRRLRPADAARALMMASHLYHTTRVSAAAQGWPTTMLVKISCEKHEAYFLGLLEQAALSLRPH